MRISTVGYSVKQGVKNIGRNKMFSLASIATMSACIFVFGLFFAIIMNFQHIVHKAEESVAITVFFDAEATESQKDKIGEKLKEQALEKLAPGIIQESKTAWQKDGDLMEFLKALQVKYK